MSATEFQPVTGQMEVCLQNFVESKEMQDNINEAIRTITNQINETWQSRKDNGLENSFKRTFIFQNETRKYTPSSYTSPTGLDTELKLELLISRFWEINDFSKTPPPFTIHEFTRACYIDVAVAIESLVVDQFKQRRDLRVECNVTPSGYFIPGSVVSVKGAALLTVCLAVPIAGWIFLPTTPSIFSGKMTLSFRAFQITR